MRVLVAMSGGVDSSVAAALLADQGHSVVGVTLKLWGGESDSGCCSVSDVEDARRVAEQLGIAHHVFDLTEEFTAAVVGPYVESHSKGLTPNPCIECNRHIKFGRLLSRSKRMGFDALATGHHARVVDRDGKASLGRGADRAKDQSYVLAMLNRSQIEGLLLPVGEMTKQEVRVIAVELGLRTAEKPDSQDVCFVHSSVGRAGFLGDRIELKPASLVDSETGEIVGSVPTVQTVTIGQRRGLGLATDGRRRYALDVDVESAKVIVGPIDSAWTSKLELGPTAWVGDPLPLGAKVICQVSSHGRPTPSVIGDGSVYFDLPIRLVSPGQTVAFYDADDSDIVVGSATVERSVPDLAAASVG